MSDPAMQESVQQALTALARLEEALTLPEPAEPVMAGLRRDAVIQRFECTYERLWKAFRRVHLTRGIAPESVRRAYEVFLEAGAAGWLQDRLVWERMIADRNATSHEYDRERAAGVYQRIVVDYYPQMRDALHHVQREYVEKSPFDGWVERE